MDRKSMVPKAFPTLSDRGAEHAGQGDAHASQRADRPHLTYEKELITAQKAAFLAANAIDPS